MLGTSQKVALLVSTMFLGKMCGGTAISPSLLPEGESVKACHDIIKGITDDREYRSITLPNGLEVLLVSESCLETASAAMDVRVGNSSDPGDIPGVAHFLEHMLFMGTVKYPSKSDYLDFLSKYRGSANAYTSAENTNFHFQVNADHFEGALDRFAQFFIAPLFNPGSVGDELNVVNSEYLNNLSNDYRRFCQLQAALSNEMHPYCHFGTGNSETLGTIPTDRGIDIRQVLIDFYKQHYSANLMKLVVYGKDTLDELQKMVISKFSAVPNHDLQVPSWPGRPLDERHFRKVIQVKTLKAARELRLSWQVDGVPEHLLKKPLIYIEGLLNRGESGSILHSLKSRGWASSVTSIAHHASHEYSFLQIVVSLTTEGRKNITGIVKIIFQYLQMLKDTGPQQWIFDESRSLREIGFNFRQKERAVEFTKTTAPRMHYYPPELVLKGASVPLVYDPILIQSFLEQLQTTNFRLFILTNEDLASTCTRQEKWYGTEYVVEELDDELMEGIANPTLNPDLYLPEPNKFIPLNLKFKGVITNNPVMHPSLIIDEGRMKLWHKQDDIFGHPRGSIRFSVKSDVIKSSKRNGVASYMLFSCLQEKMGALLNETRRAGLSLSIFLQSNGFEFRFSGYDDKLNELIEASMAILTGFQADNQRFQIIKDNYYRRLGDFVNDSPYLMASAYLRGLLSAEHCWFWEGQAELKNLEANDLDLLLAQIVTQCSTTALCHGNFTSDEAKLTFNSFVSKLHDPLSMDPAQEPKAKSILFPPNQKVIFVPPPAPNKNSAVEMFLQFEAGPNHNLRVLGYIFVCIFEQSFFNQLRTNEKLGYVVRLYSSNDPRFTGFHFRCQSELDPVTIDARIEKFLETSVAVLESMNEVDYGQYIAALLSDLQKKDKSLDEETERYWNSIIDSEAASFDDVEKMITRVQITSKNDLIDFIKSYVIGPRARKLAVHMWSDKLKDEKDVAYLNNLQDKVFTDADELKRFVAASQHA